MTSDAISRALRALALIAVSTTPVIWEKMSIPRPGHDARRPELVWKVDRLLGHFATISSKTSQIYTGTSPPRSC